MLLKDNLGEILGRLKAIPDIRVIAIFSREDRSCGSLPLLKSKELPNVEIFLSRYIYHSCKISIDAFKELE